MAENTSIAGALVETCRFHLIEKSLPRLKKVVPLLTLEELWRRPNDASNSVGNLLLHLNGNVRQWIVSGLGGAPDTRERAREFSEREEIPGDELLERLERTLLEAETVMKDLDSRELLSTRRIQGSDETGVSALVHVVEHFSYHVGQITYFVKSVKGRDTGFYAGQDLNQRNEEG